MPTLWQNILLLKNIYMYPILSFEYEMYLKGLCVIGSLKRWLISSIGAKHTHTQPHTHPHQAKLKPLWWWFDTDLPYRHWTVFIRCLCQWWKAYYHTPRGIKMVFNHPKLKRAYLSTHSKVEKIFTFPNQEYYTRMNKLFSNSSWSLHKFAILLAQVK